MSNGAPGPRVLVLLATLNGARFLEEQLTSLEAQTVANIDVTVSDDGSVDDTLAQLRAWATRWNKGAFEIVTGPGSGFADNFRSLIVQSSPSRESFVAFCDQDDVWDPEKLAVAIAALVPINVATPAMYGSRTRLIDESGRPLGLSPLFSRPPGFRNALVQSLVGGNTIVFNPAGFALVQESGRRTSFLMHDWWSYQIISGAGGVVHYDAAPHIGYRQHPNSAIGGRIRAVDRPKRLLDLLSGRLARWGDRNVASLTQCSDLLTVEARRVFYSFSTLRAGRRLTSRWKLFGIGLYRQTTKGAYALAFAILLGRL